MIGRDSDSVGAAGALAAGGTLVVLLGYEFVAAGLAGFVGRPAGAVVAGGLLAVVVAVAVRRWARSRTSRRRGSLERSEARLRVAEELAHLGSFDFAVVPGSGDHWSDEMYRILDLEPSRGPLGPQAFAEQLVHPEDRAAYTVSFERALREATPFDFSFRVRRADGSVRHVQSVGRPVCDDAGRVVRIMGSLLDVTERVAVEESLRKTEARARAFVESVGETVVAIDGMGKIVLINDRVEEMFGFRREEVLGRGLEMLLPERLRAEHERHREGYFAAPRLRPMGGGLELLGRRKNGSEFPIEVSLSFIEAEEGLLALGFVSDITERKRAEAALREAQRVAQQRERLADIGALTAKILHDLGNPLAGLSMSVQQIARRIARSPEDDVATVRAPIEHMVATVNRLDALTQDFKTFLRDQRFEATDLDLGSFLDDLVSVWRPEASARGVTLTLVQDDEDEGAVRGDAEQLRRLFDNLLKNALEAIDEGPGEIEIATRGTPENVRVTVRDDGPGIPESANVFGLFETTKAEGTGLGLPIAREIAVAHGGGIEFARVEPHGTVFTVDLPRAGPRV